MAFKALRQQWIDAGLSRGTINRYCHRVKRIFRRSVSEALVAASVLHALQYVDGLREKRSEACESEPVALVDDSTIDTTLPHLSPVVAAMVRPQQLTGCRPGEVCVLRPGDVET